MKINTFKKVLKGQNNAAQGNALGLRMTEKIVREMTIFRNKAVLRTKKVVRCFFNFGREQFRPKGVKRFEYLDFSDDFHNKQLPGMTFQFC